MQEIGCVHSKPILILREFFPESNRVIDPGEGQDKFKFDVTSSGFFRYAMRMQNRTSMGIEYIQGILR
jgi:hypothetical protein